MREEKARKEREGELENSTQREGSGEVVRLRIGEEEKHSKRRAGVRQRAGVRGEPWQRYPHRHRNRDTVAKVKPPPGQTPIRLHVQHKYKHNQNDNSPPCLSHNLQLFQIYCTYHMTLHH